VYGKYTWYYGRDVHAANDVQTHYQAEALFTVSGFSRNSVLEFRWRRKGRTVVGPLEGISKSIDTERFSQTDPADHVPASSFST